MVKHIHPFPFYCLIAASIRPQLQVSMLEAPVPPTID